jgi:hypothetical protein
MSSALLIAGYCKFCAAEQLKAKDEAMAEALRLLSPWLADARRGQHVCSDMTTLNKVEQALKGGE